MRVSVIPDMLCGHVAAANRESWYVSLRTGVNLRRSREVGFMLLQCSNQHAGEYPTGVPYADPSIFWLRFTATSRKQCPPQGNQIK
jgi:hypothetical protein